MASRDFQLTISKAGIWHFHNNEEKTVAETIETDTDRAAAIIGAAMVEIRLQAAILARLKRHVKIEGKLFHPSGPIGDFSTKIDLAHLLGLTSDEANRELHTIREIRNAFAHHLDVKDFNTQKIRAKTKNLKLIETYVGEFVDKAGHLVYNFGHDEKPRMNVWFYPDKLKEPKGRYITTVSLLARVLPCLQTEIVKRSDYAKGFEVLPKRWIVERTIAWLNRCRRLAKDWENLNRKALAFLRLASIRLMLRKLCNPL